MHFRSFTIPPLFEKQYYWVEKDSKGLLFLFRKKRKSYTYEKKVVKTRGEDEYKPAHCLDRKNPNDPPKQPRAYSYRDKHRDDESRVYKHVYHHYFPDNPPPIIQPPPPPKSPPKNSPKNGARYPEMSPTVELAPELETRHPDYPWSWPKWGSRSSPPFQSRDPYHLLPSTAPRRRASPHRTHIHRPVESNLTLEKVPVPVHKGLQHGTRLESTKLERLRPQRREDFESGHEHENEERERGRAKYRDRGYGFGHEADGDGDGGEDDRGYDSGSGSGSVSEMDRRRRVRRNPVQSPCGRGYGRGRSYSRARSVDENEEHEEHEEHASWDEDLGAYVVKRTPSVRFE